MSSRGRYSKKAPLTRRGTLLALSVFVLFLTYYIIEPVLTGMLVGAGLAYVSFPIYDRLEKRIKGKNSRAVIVMGIVFVPILIIIGISAKAILDIAQGNVSQNDLVLAVNEVINFFTRPFGYESDVGTQFVEQTLGFFQNYAVRAVNQSFRILAELTVFFATYIYTLTQAREDLHDILENIPEDTKAFFAEYHSHVAQLLDAMIFSTILTSAIAGFISFFIYWFAGFNFTLSFILAILTFLVALLPVLGSPMIYLPAAALAYTIEGLFSAILILVAGTIFLLLIPTFVLTPYFAAKYGEVHFILPLIAFVAAPIAFGGVRGFVAGPLIVSLAFATISFLRENPQLIWGKIED